MPEQPRSEQTAAGQAASRSRRRRHTRPPRTTPRSRPVRAPRRARPPDIRPQPRLVRRIHPSGRSATADAEGRPYEFPGLDDDAPAGSADAALDRLKELHRTAAAVAPQSLDAHFDQLLERQRRLISEYISEAEAPSAAADDPGDDSLVGFGGDFLGSR